MPIERDEFWKYVEVIDDKRWKCLFCDQEFTGRAPRIKAHLGKIPRMGIRPCKSNTLGEDVCSAAKAALKHKDLTNGPAQSMSKRQRLESDTGGVMPQLASETSCFVGGMMPPPLERLDYAQPFSIGSSVERQPQGPNQPADHTRASVIHASRVETGGAGSSSTSQHETINLTGTGNVVPVSSLEQKIEILQVQIKNITRDLARIWEELTQRGKDSLQQETRVEGLSTNEVEEPNERGIFGEAPPLQVQGSRGGAFFLADPIGKIFEIHMERIWNCLCADGILRIGIYGMGGVGKTFLAKHLHNKVLKDDKSFEHVFWVTMSKDDTVRDLQSKIARAVNAVNIFTNEDEKMAGLLHEHLMKIGKSVLILDDVWEEFDVKEVGIPIQDYGLKLVLTTRSLNICRKMLCEKHIKIECLLRGDAESLLFIKHLGYGSLPSGAKVVPGYFVSSCGGLPLAIVETAKAIRDMVAEPSWPSDLRNLRNLGDVGCKEMDRRIFPILKASFDQLNFQMQQCFLRCALYSYEMPRSELIELFIDERLISRSTSRVVMLKEGSLILDELIDACLLEHVSADYVGMHKVIRRMALKIMGTKCMLVVEEFHKMRDEKYWPSDLQLAGIRSNYDKDRDQQFLDGISPNCPQLSTLLLHYFRATKIPDSFFKHLSGLKVLNLSNSRIMKLPNCISELLCLEALLLRGCSRLCHIPSLAKLRPSLKKLDLFECAALEEVPDGLKCLVNLQYLDLLGTGIHQLQAVVLQKMVKLQYLSIGQVMYEGGVEFGLTTAVELEFLRGHFEDEKQFYIFTSNFHPSQYNLAIGSGLRHYSFGDTSFERLITTGGDNIREICLPKNVEKLVIDHCNTCLLKLVDCFLIEDISLCTKLVVGEEIDVIGPYLKSPHNHQSYLDLRQLELIKCAGLKYLFSASATCYLKNLRTLTILYCDKLEGIITAAAGSQLLDGALPSLESIYVERCNHMRTLVGHLLLPHLQKLRKIRIYGCSNMKEIIESNRGQSCQNLLQLESLELSALPELELIYDGMMDIESIRVFSCPKMKRIPLYLPQGADGRLSPPPSLKSIVMDSQEWWESLEWLPNINEAKTLLKPFLRDHWQVPALHCW